MFYLFVDSRQIWQELWLGDHFPIRLRLLRWLRSIQLSFRKFWLFFTPQHPILMNMTHLNGFYNRVSGYDHRVLVLDSNDFACWCHAKHIFTLIRHVHFRIHWRGLTPYGCFHTDKQLFIESLPNLIGESFHGSIKFLKKRKYFFTFFAIRLRNRLWFRDSFWLWSF